MPDFKITIEGCEPIPVSANNANAARNHVVRNKVKVEKLSIADAMAFGAKGIALQIAGEDAPITEETNEQGDGLADA